jgi:hypothetical protein
MTKLFLILAMALLPLAQADNFNLTGAHLQCSNLSDWSSTFILGTGGFEAGGGTDGGCGPLTSGFGLDFGWLLSPFATADSLNSPDGLSMFGFISVSGPAPKTPHKTRELVTQVTWTASGGGSTPDGLVDFTFSGSGTGLGYFDYTRLWDKSVRLDEVIWALTASPTTRLGLAGLDRVDPVPEVGSIWLLGLTLVACGAVRARSRRHRSSCGSNQS